MRPLDQLYARTRLDVLGLLRNQWGLEADQGFKRIRSYIFLPVLGCFLTTCQAVRFQLFLLSELDPILCHRPETCCNIAFSSLELNRVQDYGFATKAIRHFNCTWLHRVYATRHVARLAAFPATSQVKTTLAKKNRTGQLVSDTLYPMYGFLGLFRHNVACLARAVRVTLARDTLLDVRLVIRESTTTSASEGDPG